MWFCDPCPLPKVYPRRAPTIIPLRFSSRRRALPGAPVTAVEDSVLLVQLTDSHLFAEADGKLLGLNTGDSLARVVELAVAEQPRIDLILATGDLSQDGSVASYQRFRQLAERIEAPRAGAPAIMMNSVPCVRLPVVVR